MTTLSGRPIQPSASDAKLAAQLSSQLSQARQAGSELRIQADDGEMLRLPKAASDLLHDLLAEMAQGNAVALLPVHAELTTQEAADYLNVSRPFLIRLLNEGRISFRLVGTHRRVKFSDLDAFKKANEEAREKVMNDLAAQAQELEMGY